DRIQRRLDQFGLGHIGGGDRYADGQAPTFADDFDLGAFADFSDAHLVPPFTAETNVASPAPSDQSSAPSRWRSQASSLQASRSTPLDCHSCRRRQHVVGLGKRSGNSSHWAPVRRIQMMPSRQGRGGTGGRPPFSDGTYSGNRSAITTHCSSDSSNPTG